MATYRGVPYEAGMGPTPGDVVLYAACPPPEELGFEPATNHWRKRVIRAEIDALWESRPVGVFRGEPCIVLDDIGDQFHIAYVGVDPEQAARLGYWQVDRGVFELLVPRDDVVNLTEERIEKPLMAAWSPDAREDPGYAYEAAPDDGYAPPPFSLTPAGDPAWEANGIDPLEGGHSRDGRSGRDRVSAREIFSQLADLAGIPRAAYALEYEMDGSLCLMPGPDGFEVFLAADGARHEVRSFPDEESAYFYLFGVLAAEAIRTGSLARADDGQR